MAAKSKPRKAPSRGRAPGYSAPSPSFSDWLGPVMTKWMPRLAFVIAVGGSITVMYKWWDFLGLPKVVEEQAFHRTISEVKTEVSGKIKNASELLNGKIDEVGRKQDRSNVVTLELQQRQLETERRNNMNSLTSVNVQLRGHEDDQYLSQRKLELESARNEIERDLESVREQVRKARSGG